MVFELTVKGHTTHEIERILPVSHGTLCGDMKEIRQRAKRSLPTISMKSYLQLRSLQEILHNRIRQKKGEIHESHNRVYNDNLWTEIETLQWVLAQILMLLERSP
jgi:hypothetical protein